MKRKIPLLLRWKGFFMILLVATSMNCVAQNLYVGESKFLGTPDDIPYDGYVTHAWWSCTNSNIEFSKADESGAIVKPIHYFEGTATVECTYAYTYYGWDDRKQVGSGTTYFYIRCNPNYASISDTNIELNIGETHRLSYLLDEYSSIKGVWNSSNEEVATVDSKGKVKAVSSGKAQIVLDPIVGPLVYCDVEVAKVDPTSVSIPSSLTVYVGETESLSASLYPSNATTTLTWYSKDKDVATVSSGRVTGVDEGSTVVYARTDNGLTSNDCKVKVYYRTATSISLDNTSLTLPVGDSKRLKYSFAPSHAKVSVRWSSSNPSVVSVSNDGTLTALATGEASVTATTDNGLTAKCKIKVLPLPIQLALPETLTLDWSDSYKLTVQSYPSESYLDLEWTSSDESVVTVSADGEVKGVETGHTTVTVTASNGITASCDVEVTVPKCVLNLWLHDGSCFAYPFSDRPIIQANKKVTIVKTKKESIEYNTADVRKYTLSKVEPVAGEYSEITSIEDLQVNTPRLRMKQDCIVLSQCEPDMPIGVYSVSGQLIETYRMDSNGYLVIPINNLSKGIYIIKSKSITYKIARK